MGPSGVGTLCLLLAAFVAAAYGLGRGKRWPLQVVCSLVAFLTAGVFGISSVNRYYDYYDSWSALASDLQADSSSALPVQIPLARGVPRATAGDSELPPDLDPWSLHRLDLPGGASGVRGRQALVVMPPASLVHGPLPVMLFLHGEPGTPDALATMLQLAGALQRQAALGKIGGMAVVLPDVRGYVQNQQCLDVRGHPALGTWLRTEVPADISAQLDVAPPGTRWVATGLSEGGYCATDLALHQPGTYRGAAEMDGYSTPDLSHGILRKAFDGSRLRAAQDSPRALVAGWKATRRLPAFWIMAGTGNSSDYDDAVRFGTLVGKREDPRYVTVEGGRHTRPAWVAALPDLLRWAWLTTSGHAVGGSVDLPLR